MTTALHPPTAPGSTPAPTPGVEPAATLQGSHLGQQHPSVLIVANRSVNDRLIRATLGRSCKTLERVPQADAFAAARSTHPDLIIVDGGDAPARSAAFLGAIRRDSELSDTAVVILSRGSGADESEWRRAGADECISGRLQSSSLLNHTRGLLHSSVQSDPEAARESTWHQMSRTLHDETMQRLFAIGMTLEATCRAKSVTEISRRIGDAVTEIDSTIVSIRSAIFETR